MEPVVTEHRRVDRSAEWSDRSKRPRSLTHDEKKAAEAAFRQAPFNPEWSEAARRVYEGIADAVARMKPNSLLALQMDPELEAVWD